MARDELGKNGGKLQPSYGGNTVVPDFRNAEHKMTDEETNKEVDSLLDEIP